MILDSWSTPPSQNPLESLQSWYVEDVSFQSMKLEWISKCPKVRPFHLLWKTPTEPVFSPIPSSVLSHAMGNLFCYQEMVTSCRVNRYFSNSVIVDEAVIKELPADTEVRFSTLTPLPQGLSIGEVDGTISGYPTMAIQEWKGSIMMTVNRFGSVYTFRNSIVLSILGGRSFFPIIK